MFPKRKKGPVLASAALSGLFIGSLLGYPQASLAVSGFSATAASQPALMDDESSSIAAVTAKLNKKQFQNVKATVENGIATLTGTVDLYEYKADAGKRVQKAKGVTAVRNEIQIGGPTVPDQQLQSKLLEKLQYDRVGYGNAFNSISLQVSNGVVTLAGHARTDVDKDSAMALVSTYPGVKDVVEEIEVDPVSFMDDRIRMEVARSVYGYPSLNKYAVDPAKPIRISVQMGNVELYGVVDSQSDKDVAYLRANTVPGVFSVKNNLQVAGKPEDNKSGN